MKYYLHDCNSFNDEKVSELFLQYGYEGLGLFYTLLEKVGAQEKPIKTTVLKHQLKVGKRLDKCWDFMESIGIISTVNGETFSERILSYSEKYKIKKEKNREKISQWRENQIIEKNVTSYEPNCNDHKVNRSKVNINRTNVLVADATPELRKKYSELQEELRTKPIGEIYTTIKNFVEEHKPDFPDPYIDAWNLVAGKYGLVRVTDITDDRKQKMKTRVREPGFNFFKIMEAITKFPEYRGENNSGWKVTFNYLLKSQKNYTEMIEKLGE